MIIKDITFIKFVKDNILLNKFLIDRAINGKKKYISTSKAYQYYCIKLKHYKKDKKLINKLINYSMTEPLEKHEISIILKELKERRNTLNTKLGEIYNRNLLIIK